MIFAEAALYIFLFGFGSVLVVELYQAFKVPQRPRQPRGGRERGGFFSFPRRATSTKGGAR